MHVSQSSGASIRRIAEEAAGRGASVVLSIGPSQPPAQPTAAGPGPVGPGVHSEPQPSVPAHSRRAAVGDDPVDGRCADAEQGEESVRRDAAYGGVGGMADCPAEVSAEECHAEGGDDDDDGFCYDDIDDADEKSEHCDAGAPRAFGNPLLRDYQPRAQQLEMLIPPHAFPWVVQRIMGGGDPQAALNRIAAFTDEAFVFGKQESCEALHMPSAAEQLASQRPVEPPTLSTKSTDEAPQEASAE